MNRPRPFRAVLLLAGWRWVSVLVLLGLVLGGAYVRLHRPVRTQAVAPVELTVPRGNLENREDRWYLPGAAAPFTGWVTDAYKDGGLKLRTAVVDGQYHGLSEGWHTNQVLELRETFNRGKPQGTRTTWYPTGQKRSEGELIAGLQQGVYRQWHENGMLAAEAEFKNGKAHGLSRAWHASGCLKAEALVKEGVVETRHFYTDGERREPTLLVGATTP